MSSVHGSARFSPLPAGLCGDTLALAMDGSPLNILLVEDHVDTAHVTTLLLKRDGHSVRLAPTLADARRLCDEEHFDVMLTNLQLPDGDTWELLREGEPCRKIPAVIYSAHGTQQHIDQSMAAGFKAHLVKPVSAHTLRAALRKAVEKN
jgi:CheY-like chemotaxis protein